MPDGASVAKTGAQVPGIYRMRVGAFEVTALLDGYIDLPAEAFTGGTEAERAKLQSDNLLPVSDKVRIPVNAYVVHTGDRIVLIDAGSADSMGPTMGRLPENLAAAGIRTEQIDAVFVTHAHGDHINGVTNANGEPVFPNAELILGETEWSFWTADETRSLAKGKRWERVPDTVARVTAPYKGRISQAAAGENVIPGISTTLLPGHTPGQTGFLLDSAGETCLVWGDVIHIPAFQLVHPEWGFGFDVDSGLASETRARTLDMAATDRLMVAGMHLPFPGVGHIVKDGGRYSFVPAPWVHEL